MEIQAILIRIDDTQDKCFFQYIHANDSTPIIYVKICGTLHPFSFSTVGRIWIQFSFSKALHRAVSSTEDL